MFLGVVWWDTSLIMDPWSLTVYSARLSFLFLFLLSTLVIFQWFNGTCRGNFILTWSECTSQHRTMDPSAEKVWLSCPFTFKHIVYAVDHCCQWYWHWITWWLYFHKTSCYCFGTAEEEHFHSLNHSMNHLYLCVQCMSKSNAFTLCCHTCSVLSTFVSLPSLCDFCKFPSGPWLADLYDQNNYRIGMFSFAL